MIYGYDVSYGYIGWVERLNRYIPFACYRDYIEYIEEDPK